MDAGAYCDGWIILDSKSRDRRLAPLGVHDAPKAWALHEGAVHGDGDTIGAHLFIVTIVAILTSTEHLGTIRVEIIMSTVGILAGHRIPLKVFAVFVCCVSICISPCWFCTTSHPSARSLVLVCASCA
jgi:hypothetical protein